MKRSVNRVPSRLAGFNRDRRGIEHSPTRSHFVSEKVYIGKSPFGVGVFAKVHIEPRETIIFLNGALIGFEETQRPQGEYAVQIGSNEYVDPIRPGRYLNHSCEPNAGFVEGIQLIALEAIAPGEEVVFDYSTTMLERSWELDCQCGAKQCRGRIQDFDLLPASLQRRYLQLGIVQNFILEALRIDEEAAA